MSNNFLTFRALLIFGVCVSLAVFLGYIVASPFDWTALIVFTSLLSLLAVPLLLRWHFPIMILSWNMNAIVFVLPGRPPFWLFMMGLSLILSLAYYALDKREKYLSVPEIIRPLVFLALVVIITVKIRGGIGLGALGGEVSGGKRYILLLGSILGYFAFTCHGIPLKRAYSYTSAFFLGGGSAAIGNLLPLVNPAFYFIFAIFPPEQSGLESIGLVEEAVVTRFGGLSLVCTAIFFALLACYGIRGIFDLSNPLKFLPFRFRGGVGLNKPWRLIIFLVAVGISLLGGFRSTLILFAITFGLQFYFEKLFRTRLFPTLVLSGILGAVVILPVANKLPLAMQRTLSFLPIDIDPVALSSAQVSTEWRLMMWKRVWPQVPQYLFIGKGYALSSRELELMTRGRGQSDTSDIAVLAGDYHSGPLSLLMPFGIFGAITFIWFIIASIKVLSKNYRFSDPALLNVNRFLLAHFVTRAIFFFVFFGSLYSDLAIFVGIVGLSVSLNHGVRKEPSRLDVTEQPSAAP